MATVNLTSASDGSIRFASNDDNVPIFIVIGDSYAQGTLGGMTGQDAQIDYTYTYGCKNFQRQFTMSDAIVAPISDSSKALGTFKVWDQSQYLMNAPVWANTTAYVVGDRRRQGGTAEDNQYVCIKDHTSATANDQPGTGTNWEDYWVKAAGWGYTGDATHTGRTFSGTFTTGKCVERLPLNQSGTDDGWSAAAWSDAITWCGGSRTAAAPPETVSAGYSDDPFDGQTASLHLRDNNILWTFSRFMAANQVFKDADGGVVYPRYIHCGINASAVAEAAEGIYRAFSWSAGYAAPVNGSTRVGAYQWFHDTYLKPALNDVITGEGKNAWIAGVIFMVGSSDCRNDYNDSPSGGAPGFGYRVCDQLGTNVAALADAFETACSIADIPFMVMEPLDVPVGSDGTDATGNSRYYQAGINALHADFRDKTYRYTFAVQKKDSDDRHIGLDNIHLTATGACRLGFELADQWYTNFVDKGLTMSTATEPSEICPRS